MLFDSHAHLNDEQFDDDRDEVIRRAREQGVSRILNIGFNRETIQSTLALAERYDFIYAAVGWHPHDAAAMTDADLKWLRSLTEHPKVVALGEMGLDYYRNHSPRAVQEEVFRRQIRLAREVGLPIITHNREADDDVLRVLREEGAAEVGGVMHCFGGDWEMAQRCLEMNFLIGLGGPVTFKNARLPKEIAVRIPLDRLLIETDAPYLAPHPHRGKRNESGYVRLVAEAIAGFRGIPFEEVARQTDANARRLFRIGEAA